MLRLLRAQARRDRVTLTIWILAIALFGVGSGSAVLKEFGSLKDREAVIGLASSSPALLAIRGVPDGASTGATVNFELFVYLALCVALMSTFLVVRHSRGDEERGRTELVGSTPIHRASALGATLILGTLANVAVAVLLALGYTASGFPAGGSWMIGFATGAVGLAFVGIGAIAAQVAKTGRSANSLAGAVIAIAFVLRAIGDATGTPSKNGLHLTSTWPSWISPIGWGQQARAYGANNPFPLLLDIALFVVLAVAALAIVRVRDLGAGLVGERPGRATAGIGLRNSFGLAWRLQRTSLVSWSIGAVVLGLFAGGLADIAVDAVKKSPALGEAVKTISHAQSASLLDAFVAAIMAFLAVLAAAAAIQAVMRVRSEEADGRTELLLSTPIDRARPLLYALLVAVISVVVVTFVGGLVTGLVFIGIGHPDRFWSSLGAAFVQIPAALVFAGVIAFVVGLLPRATVGLGWGLLAIGFILGEFGPSFKFPDWVNDISPFTHTPAEPGSTLNWAALSILFAVAVVTGLAGLVLVRRRDLTT